VVVRAQATLSGPRRSDRSSVHAGERRLARCELTIPALAKSMFYHALRYEQEVNARRKLPALTPCSRSEGRLGEAQAEENLRLCSTESRNGPVFHTPTANLLLGILT
jgi:hypothetical protein